MGPPLQLTLVFRLGDFDPGCDRVDVDEDEPDCSCSMILESVGVNQYLLVEPTSLTPFGPFGPTLDLGTVIEAVPVAEGRVRYIRTVEAPEVWTRHFQRVDRPKLSEAAVQSRLSRLLELGCAWEWAFGNLIVQGRAAPDGDAAHQEVSRLVEEVSQLLEVGGEARASGKAHEHSAQLESQLAPPPPQRVNQSEGTASDDPPPAPQERSGSASRNRNAGRLTAPWDWPAKPPAPEEARRNLEKHLRWIAAYTEDTPRAGGNNKTSDSDERLEAETRADDRPEIVALRREIEMARWEGERRGEERIVERIIIVIYGGVLVILLWKLLNFIASLFIS